MRNEGRVYETVGREKKGYEVKIKNASKVAC